MSWITMKYAVSRMKMPYVRESATSLLNAHVWHMEFKLSAAHYIRFYLIDFYLQISFPNFALFTV